MLKILKLQILRKLIDKLNFFVSVKEYEKWVTIVCVVSIPPEEDQTSLFFQSFFKFSNNFISL